MDGTGADRVGGVSGWGRATGENGGHSIVESTVETMLCVYGFVDEMMIGGLVIKFAMV